jgi:hypothetical protein
MIKGEAATNAGRTSLTGCSPQNHAAIMALVRFALAASGRCATISIFTLEFCEVVEHSTSFSKAYR